MFESGESSLMELHGAPHASGRAIGKSVTPDEKDEEDDGCKHQTEGDPEFNGHPDTGDGDGCGSEACPAQETSL
jgi:hypothetical protein